MLIVMTFLQSRGLVKGRSNGSLIMSALRKGTIGSTCFLLPNRNRFDSCVFKKQEIMIIIIILGLFPIIRDWNSISGLNTLFESLG
jgi:hypothetical protein